jgi:hypothetical protein
LNRLFIYLSYALVVSGLLACLGGLFSANLTPLVLGGILMGLGGTLLYLVRLERRLTEALPALNSLSQTARFLALKESPRAPVVEPESDPSPGGAGLRDGDAGVVGVHPASSDGRAARA